MASAQLYGAQWCAACHNADKYLKTRGVSVTWRPVDDANPRDAAHWRVEADMKRLSVPGQEIGGEMIPIIDLDGHILVGFSESAIDAVLGVGPADPEETPDAEPMYPKREPSVFDDIKNPFDLFGPNTGWGGLGLGLLVLAVLWASKNR